LSAFSLFAIGGCRQRGRIPLPFLRTLMERAEAKRAA
jgi:hypothetical protein